MYIVIEDCDKIELVFLVNNENLGDIKLIFKKIKILKYLGSLSIILSFIMKKCFSLFMY